MRDLPSTAARESRTIPSEPAVFDARRRTQALEAGISPRHLANLTGKIPLTETRSLALVKAFMACQDAWCLTLLGHHGVGKTFAGEWLVMQAVAANDRSCKLVTPGELRDQSHVPEQRQALQSKRLLMIDDLGYEALWSLDVFRAQLFEVINYRWRCSRKTLLTTNLSAAAFQRRYGRRITDRICDNGRCVAVTGSSFRN